MAIIKPFKGYRYNSAKINNFGEVMAPPYDSLSDEQTDSFYDRNPYNAARLVSQRKLDADDENNNCYTRSRDFLNSWIEDKILIREDKPALYIYEETVTINRENYYNRGIVALLELTDYADGTVVPCEHPSTNSKNDRFNMISSTQSNNSLISCMYTDRDKVISATLSEIAEGPADMEFTTWNDIKHKLWAVTDEKIIKMITEALREKKIFIVDGHNRYEACLEYKNKQKAENPDYTGEESYNYVMTLISDSHDDGRVHLPVHRLVKTKHDIIESYFIAGIQEHFLVEKIIVDKLDDDMYETMRKQISTQRKETRIAMYTGKNYFFRFTFRDNKYIDMLMPEISESYRYLDINILNKLILEEQLGIDTDKDDSMIGYTRNIFEGMKAVDNNDFDCMFVMNPVRPAQLAAMTVSGERLPKRSVSIFPKPATGIVIHKFTPHI
ncbi:MAG: DUF1015 domain-containing protein [Clostridia bacterium]|nr:DUF1015 domain-containing protein [Clostridia bacterium]